MERLLGYHAAELAHLQSGEDGTFGAGRGAIACWPEMKKLCNVYQAARAHACRPHGRLSGLRAHAAAQHGAQLRRAVRRKDGDVIPVTLHISALRDASGEFAGMVAVAVDQSAILHREQAQRESQERYRDLFEHSSEMIATLSPAGQFLYANPAWKRCFGLEHAALIALHSFEELFSEGIRSEVAALFRRALDGEMVDRVPLRHHTPDGRVLELELSLSRRQKAGIPLAVRCLLRDVTQQKQRENRLALQLAVSQIVGENASGESAAMRILEALCISQGWDVAIEWLVDAEQKRLEFGTAWGVPGRRAEALIQGSMGLTAGERRASCRNGMEGGRTVWIADLAAAPPVRAWPRRCNRRWFQAGQCRCARQQSAGGAGVLLPLQAARRPRGHGRGGNCGRFAGPDAGADPGTRPGRRTETPAGDSARLRDRRHLRAGSRRAR